MALAFAFLKFLTLLLALSAVVVVEGFSSPNKSARRAAKPVEREDLPTLDTMKGSLPVDAPKGVSSRDFYLPTYTLLRAGPVSFVRRVADGKTYEQYVWKYMKDFKEDSLMTAQGNADAYLASADDWAEQKYLEGLGRREAFDYGKPLPTERVVLSSIWGGFVALLASRVVWQLLHGNRNLF
mmetsp:Transcript_102116/g.286273  ORF Transcript_102116/g.286273 Transcript_102116/m.286273 type:complete len:182 (-) Transcript_102116:21-566(-)